MKLFGVTNQITINNSDLGIFMYDFDKIDIDYILDEAKILSEMFDFDLFVLESSENSFHFISFDIMTRKEISLIQNHITVETDYININDFECDKYNILRLGDKGSKKSPKYITHFLNKKNKRLKSLGHYKIYRKLCNVPIIKEYTPENFLNTHVEMILYQSHKYRIEVKNKWI